MMEDGAGMARRHSPTLHPQIQPREEGAGVDRPSSTRIHPQIEASKEGAGVTCRRSHGTSTVAPESLPFNDDMLRDILIRLPPQPSSLLRASAVCKRWLEIVTDSKFQSQFRAHHRKPPLLGVFQCTNQGIVFSPVLDPPDRIPPVRFSRWSGRADYDLLDCRHGLVLIRVRNEVLVCDPITGEQHCVAVPSELERSYLRGAVLCAADDHGHVHRACHLSSYKVVLVSRCRKDERHIAFVYSSETGICGNLISTEAPRLVHCKSAVLVGNCLYWLSLGDDILEFHLGRHSLTVIKGPLVTNDIFLINSQIIQAEHGVVAYAILSYPGFQIWQRNVSGHGVGTWVHWKTIEMDSTLNLAPPNEEVTAFLLGYDEDSDVIFLSVSGNIYTVQLKSMQSRKLCEIIDTYRYYPFKSFYTPGTTIACGFNGAEMLNR